LRSSRKDATTSAGDSVQGGSGDMDDDSAVAELPAHDPELLLYDYFKHISSLVLITLGGLLIVMKDFGPKDVRPAALLITFLFVSSSGIVAFSGTQEIVRARATGKPTRRWLNLSRIAAPNLLAVGLGVFLAMFYHRLTH
jgi:hypothetical protein